MNSSIQSIFGLEGKTALVTGSSRGIGAAIAHGLAGAGAGVIVHGSTPGSTHRVTNEIQSEGGKVWEVSAELGSKGAGKKLIANANAVAGSIDILVINASAQINAELQDVSSEDIDTQFNVNLRATIEMLQACLPQMANRRWGRVINIGSINQLRPKSIVTAYAATKAAQHNVVQSQARDYARQGVLINTLAPGLIDTDRNLDRKTNNPDAWQAYVREVNWMGRAGEASEMVGAAIFLASDACSFMTGESIFLTGGM